MNTAICGSVSSTLLRNSGAGVSKSWLDAGLRRLQDIAVLVDQHRAGQIARGRARGQQLAKGFRDPGRTAAGHSRCRWPCRGCRRGSAGRARADRHWRRSASSGSPRGSALRTAGRGRGRCVTLATIDTSTAGSTAITENRLTIWTCSRAAARPRRRAWTTCQTSRTMITTSSRMVAALISRKRDDDLAGSARSASGRSARRRSGTPTAAPAPTANGASQPAQGGRLRGSASDGSSDGADVSALVILAIGRMNANRPPPPADRLMHSYNNVAQLRQFRGAAAASTTRTAYRTSTAGIRAIPAQSVSRRSDRPECRGRGSSCAACCG